MHVTRNSDFGYGYALFLPMTVGDDAHVVPETEKRKTSLLFDKAEHLTPHQKKSA